MPDSRSVFIADSCIGGFSVLKSLWDSGRATEATFLADYHVNPLGIKDDGAIANVVERWLTKAGETSSTLVMACNTLSIRYELMRQCGVSLPNVERVVSMVDCFKTMVQEESHRLVDKRVLIIGTHYTASQEIYLNILTDLISSVRVSTVAATQLERQVARIEPWDAEVVTKELSSAVEQCDYAVLACTCFPMVEDRLQALFPRVVFLNPGIYCAQFLEKSTADRDRKLDLRVTGSVVTKQRATAFAQSYFETSFKLG